MEKKEFPPPYSGPAVGPAKDPLAAYPPPQVMDPPPYSAAMVQSGMTVAHGAPPPVVVQSQVQPPVTIVQQAPQPAVVVVNTVVVQPRLGEVPGQLTCTYCRRDVVTVTRHINGVLTWSIFAGLCIFLIWPFCLIPFCVSSCQDVEHKCPNCGNILYIYKRA